MSSEAQAQGSSGFFTFWIIGRNRETRRRGFGAFGQGIFRYQAQAYREADLFRLVSAMRLREAS